MSRLLLALVLGGATVAATGCYGTSGYAAVDHGGYYDSYPSYYGVYTTSPYYGRYYRPYYGPYYGAYRYPSYRSTGRYYRSTPNYYRTTPSYRQPTYDRRHRAAPVIRDHRAVPRYSPGYHARPSRPYRR